MAFEIIYHPDCLKDLSKMDTGVKKRIQSSIEERLAENPAEFGKPLRYSAKGLWSLRVGDWRVVYQILGEKVLVLRIGHRKEVYSIF